MKIFSCSFVASRRFPNWKSSVHHTCLKTGMRSPRNRPCALGGGCITFSGIIPTWGSPQRRGMKCHVSEESLIALFSSSFVTQRGFIKEAFKRVLRFPSGWNHEDEKESKEFFDFRVGGTTRTRRNQKSSSKE
jgi:hypothetical protein